MICQWVIKIIASFDNGGMTSKVILSCFIQINKISNSAMSLSWEVKEGLVEQEMKKGLKWHFP